MNIEAIISSLGNVGAPLASLLVILLAGYHVVNFLVKALERTLDMFTKHGEALKSIENNMQAHTLVIKELGSNIIENTKATERMSILLDKKIH